MKSNTIKWNIFKYNLIVISMLIVLVAIIYNITIYFYIENDIISQMNKIATHTVNTALLQGSAPNNNLRKHYDFSSVNNAKTSNEKKYRYYLMLNRSLKEPLSLLNAEYILLDKGKKVITSLPEMYDNNSSGLSNQLVSDIGKASDNFSDQKYVKLNISGINYIAIVKPLTQKNGSSLGWIIIYSSLQKVNQLQFIINIILLIILIFSSMITALLSSNLSKKFSIPFYSLNEHIKAIAERDFGSQIEMPVYDELLDVVSSINIMSKKLETYDKAQKTFLQNVSHEFRTPLMSIQSYAEGIKYNVVDSDTAVDIILDESKRMASLIEELLYLSRLDAIDENYHFEKINLSNLVNCSMNRLKAIAAKNNIKVITNHVNDKIEILADEEKFSRAITNIISNCIRYAKTTVTIDTKTEDENILKLSIYDDGPGFEPTELPNIFKRFYKGKNGNFGLGLSISKNVIERHKGKISVENNSSGGALFIIQLPI